MTLTRLGDAGSVPLFKTIDMTTMNLKKLAIVAVVVVVGSWAYDLRDANKVQEQIEEQRSFSALKN